MKKGFIFTAGLALVLGCGVAVGAHQASNAKEASAAPVSTVYCKMTYDWWTTADAAIGAYCWNSEDDSQKNAEFPGVRMTPVDGQEGLWTYTIPNGYDKVIFTRVNGSGAIENWGAQTDDLDVPSIKNCFTITSDTAQWKGEGHTVQGAWSVYPAVAPEYHVLGSFNSWNDPDDDYILTVDAGDSNHYTFSDLVLTADATLKVCDVKNDDWYGDADGNNVVIPSNGTYDIDFYVSADPGTAHVVATKDISEPVFTVKNRSNAPVEMVLDESDKPAGVVHQYSAELEYACRGGVLKFFRDGVEITANIGVDWDVEHDVPVPGNNIYGNTTDGFRIRHTYDFLHTTKVYLKTYSDGGVSLWGEGYDEDSMESAIMPSRGSSAQTAYLLRDDDFEPNETYLEQYKTPGVWNLYALEGKDWDDSFNMMVDGIATEVTPEPGATNNARQAFQDTAWKVHNDCTQTIYVKVKRADLSLWLYVGGYEESHVVTIGGNNIPLTKYDENQYKASGVSLTAGDEVTAYTIEGSPVSITAKADAHNNLTSGKKVISTIASADIYYNVSEQSLWISGLPSLANGFHLYVNTTVYQLATRVNEYSQTEYYSTLLTFAADDEIRFIHIQDDAAPVIFGDAAVEGGEQSANFEYDSVKGCIVAQNGCNSALYFKPGTPNNVWFADVSQELKDARTFAQGFNTSLGATCNAGGSSDKDALYTAWEAQKTTFGSLTEEAQNILKGATSSHDVEDIAKFIAKYEYIAAKYGSYFASKDASYNFLGEGHVPTSLYGGPVDNNNSVPTASIIAIVSVVSVLSISAIIVLVAVKKRKHN